MLTYAQATIVIKKFINELKKQNKISMITPVGSYRRKAEMIGDIDLLTTTELKLLKLTTITNVSKIISGGDKRISLIYKCKVGIKYKKVQIDLFYTKKSLLPFALLHHTGNKLQNIKLRKRANDMGYKLNQYGLFDLSTGLSIKHDVKNEKDIFDLLKKKYKKPEERN